MTGVQTCALPICFPVTITSFYRADLSSAYIKSYSKGKLWFSNSFWGICLIPSIKLLYIYPNRLSAYPSCCRDIYFLHSGGALYKRLENSVVLFLGYCFLFVILINDILYYNGVVDTSFLMPLGLFVMVFSQAFVLSKKASVAFRDISVTKGSSPHSFLHF